MAKVKLGGVKTWEEVLREQVRWTFPPEGPRFLEPRRDHEAGRAIDLNLRESPRFVTSWDQGLTWTYAGVDLEAELKGAREDSQTIVREGILTAHPWLRYPPEPERPVVLEVTRPAIPLSRVLSVFSELLGFDVSRRLVEATFTIGGVILEVYSEGPDGRRFALGPDREVARDRIVLPIDRGE